jgi:hypothetical protein
MPLDISELEIEYLAFIWFDGNMYFQMGGYMISFGAYDSTIIPIARKTQIVCLLSANMLLIHMVE